MEVFLIPFAQANKLPDMDKVTLIRTQSELYIYIQLIWVGLFTQYRIWETN